MSNAPRHIRTILSARLTYRRRQKKSKRISPCTRAKTSGRRRDYTTVLLPRSSLQQYCLCFSALEKSVTHVYSYQTLLSLRLRIQSYRRALARPLGSVFFVCSRHIIFGLFRLQHFHCCFSCSSVLLLYIYAASRARDTASCAPLLMLCFYITYGKIIIYGTEYYFTGGGSFQTASPISITRFSLRDEEACFFFLFFCGIPLVLFLGC